MRRGVARCGVACVWRLRGVAWRGVAWRGVAWRGVAWRASFGGLKRRSCDRKLAAYLRGWCSITVWRLSCVCAPASKSRVAQRQGGGAERRGVQGRGQGSCGS